MHDWSSLDNQQWLSMASDNDLYLLNNDRLYDITPANLPAPIGASQLRGWGAGPWGLDTVEDYLGDGWSTPRNAINLRVELPIWSLDNWGQDLMASRRAGPIYVWQRTNGPGVRAQVIPNAPISNNWILVSSEDRHLISFGSHDGDKRDQSLIRWCSQEDYNDWEPREDNTAGDKRLDSGSRILTAVRTRGEVIIFTDRSLYSMFFVGGQQVYEFQPKGESLVIAGPNAAVEAGGIIFFMAKDEFVAYDGVTKILPCTVRSFVFDNINTEFLEKVYASVNKQESEVWWFYPDSTSEENNRYVIYNYRDGTWYYGSIERTAYIDAGFIENPLAVDPEGTVFKHEEGYSDNGAPMPSFLESWDMELNDVGDFFGHISKFIPDFLTLEGGIDFTFRARQYPTSPRIEKGPYAITDQTRRINFRVRGRQIAVRFDDDGNDDVLSNNTNWRHGTLRVEVVPDGRR